MRNRVIAGVIDCVMRSADELWTRYVRPFYLKMMGTNAADNGLALAPDISRVAMSVAPEEVITLLGDNWRPRVMGAWLSVRYEGAEVRRAVFDALVTSLGWLDAPPLAVAAVVLGRPAATPALGEYFAADEANDWGASRVIAAAGEHLRQSHGTDVSLPPPEAGEIEILSSLITVA